MESRKPCTKPTTNGKDRLAPMKNNKGMTLIELIVALGMAGAVLLLAGTLLLFGNRNFSRQTDKIDIQSRARYSMDYLTREIRKASDVKVNEEGNIIIVDSSGIESEIKIEDNSLYKNSQKIATGIESLTISQDENEIKITIDIKDKNGEEHKLSSVVYVRQGGNS